MSNANIDLLVKTSLEFIKTIKPIETTISQMDFKNWKSIRNIVFNIKSLTHVLSGIILSVEKTSIDLSSKLQNLTSDDKLTAASQILDNLIPLPWYIEIIDDKIFKFLLTLIVEKLNKKVGKKWNLDELSTKIETGVPVVDGLTIDCSDGTCLA